MKARRVLVIALAGLGNSMANLRAQLADSAPVELALAATDVEARRVLDERGTDFDCVVLDAVGSEADASAWLGQSSWSAERVPVVVVSGSTDPAVRQRVIAAGAQDFVEARWLTRESLSRSVDNAIERVARERRTSERRFRALTESLRQTLTDIDDLKRTHEEFREERDRLSRVAASVPGVICSFKQRPDGSSCLPYASPAIETLFSLKPADLADDATPMFRLIHPEDLGPVVDSIARSAETMQAWRAEFRVRNPTRGEIWVEGHSAPTRESDGSIVWHGQLAEVTERKRVEDALRTSDQRIWTMVDAMPQLGFMANADGYTTWYNQQWYAYTGTTLRQMEGWGWQSVHDPAVLPDVLVRWKHSIATAQPFEMEVPLRGADGEFRNFLTRVLPFRDAQGRVTQWFGTSTDVSELRRAAETLKQREGEARALLDSLVEGVVFLDTAGVVKTANNALQTVLGRTLRELTDPALDPRSRIIRGDGSLFPVDQQPAMVVLTTGKAVRDVEMGVPLLDGTGVKWISVNAQPVRDASDRIVGVVTSFFDVTDRKRTHELLRENQARLQVMIDHIEDGLVISDERGDLLNWNAKGLELHGFASVKEEPPAFPIFQVTSEDGRPLAIDQLPLERVLRGEPVRDVELRVRRADGSSARIFKYSGSLVRGSAGKTLAFLIMRDVTAQRRGDELERQNQRIQQESRLKSEFLANMSHELRTPLNAIIGFADLMNRGMTGPLHGDQGECVSEILISGRHLLRLINDVLDLAKVESGKTGFRPEVVDLASVAVEVRDLLRTEATQKSIRLEFEVEPSLGEVFLDVTRLKQVLYNFLSNALKFTPDGGEVTLRIRSEGNDRFRLEVEDTGIGIEPTDLDRLFVEFQQLDSTTAKKHQGTGLGLALTRRLVVAQGGNVGVTSTPGVGSVFWAVLPRRPRVELEGTTSSGGGSP